ncbi:hypothetical protein SKAU_G00191800 [Synaphobranchus kaupii]|uniref:Integrase zinc-binding domain-containing protein n=1 Tax=Synaphobranchus kaupii TaxID=118154 RepID=A0A9Q1FDP3_SYNKA|nr:hypothetical protein SKAU_G00191800 [Synaphobranchus kaupii]
MFHQVCLLPEDRSLLRFVSRDMEQLEPLSVYEWQVLPFGTMCSPCCATFALQHHVNQHSQPDDPVKFSVQRGFYVDNCLQSLPTPEEAKLKELLSSEIQDLTDFHAWRYVDSASNPANNLTHGKTLTELVEPNRCSQGPPFLLLSKKLTVHPVGKKHPDSWNDLLEITAQELHGAADSVEPLTADDYRGAETVILKVQQDSFPEELCLLKAKKSVFTISRLLTLSPELDDSGELIQVGGRLRRSEDLEPGTKHPIIRDPTHPTTRLLIQHFNNQLCHPGPERGFAEIRRKYWILRGCEVVRRYQHACIDCRCLKARPVVPKMADLPPVHLRLFKPAFYSTGMDCFWLIEVKVGRRCEKRWGIIFKCLTTRAVHFLSSIDSFLMALRRFLARRGTPAKLFSDQERESCGRPLLKCLQTCSGSSPNRIAFHFNPPAASHFGGKYSE